MMIDLQLVREARAELDDLRGRFPAAFVGRTLEGVLEVTMVRPKNEGPKDKMVLTGLKITPRMRDMVDMWREQYRATRGIKLARTDAIKMLVSMALESEGIGPIKAKQAMLKQAEGDEQ